MLLRPSKKYEQEINRRFSPFRFFFTNELLLIEVAERQKVFQNEATIFMMLDLLFNRPLPSFFRVLHPSFFKEFAATNPSPPLWAAIGIV